MADQKNSPSIIELLQYVRRNKETGCLIFEENGARFAELYFKQGHLTHAQNNKVEGDDVVYQLLGKSNALIRWERGIAPQYETVTKNDEVLLLGALGILTEDDAESIISMVSHEAEQQMATTFSASPSQTPLPPIKSEVVTALPNPVRTEFANPNPPRPPVEQPVFVPANTFIAPADTGTSPEISTTAPIVNPFESMPQLRTLVGDEVLRPPRFRKWKGLPLPFVNAFSLETYPNSHNVRAVLELLWNEGFSGFMTVVANKGEVEGVSILFKGRPIYNQFAVGNSVIKDQNALRRLMEFNIPPNEPNALLIYPLEADFVHSYSALLMGETLLDKFSSQGMKINKLLNTLENSRHNGVVRVTSEDEIGYIFLSGGQKLGSYYELSDILEDSILRVYQIVGKAGSLIDVLTSPNEANMFEVVVRPKSGAEVKQQMIEIAHEILGKRSSRVVSLIAQSEDDAASLKTYANQARRVTQMFIDKGLADKLYERFLFLINELG
jgi:Domain of unknown function (DUF4388)